MLFKDRISTEIFLELKTPLLFPKPVMDWSIEKIWVKLVKKQETKFKSSKALSDKDNPNFVFKDEAVDEVGKMPDKEI